ncbi:hypothetical protein MUP46_03005 [Patescibacteria group bacterium]|nr:hypothetical protein [Patescibacteria group bacterium]
MENIPEKSFTEFNATQNKLLQAIFSMTDLQLRIALIMLVFGVDLENSLATSLRLSPGN